MECPNCSESNGIGAGKDGDRACGTCGFRWNISDPVKEAKPAPPVSPDLALDSQRLSGADPDEPPDESIPPPPGPAAAMSPSGGLVTPEQLEDELGPLRSALESLRYCLDEVEAASAALRAAQEGAHLATLIMDASAKSDATHAATATALADLATEISELSSRLGVLETGEGWRRAPQATEDDPKAGSGS